MSKQTEFESDVRSKEILGRDSAMVAGFYTQSDKVDDKVREKFRSCAINNGTKNGPVSSEGAFCAGIRRLFLAIIR